LTDIHPVNEERIAMARRLFDGHIALVHIAMEDHLRRMLDLLNQYTAAPQSGGGPNPGGALVLAWTQESSRFNNALLDQHERFLNVLLYTFAISGFRPSEHFDRKVVERLLADYPLVAALAAQVHDQPPLTRNLIDWPDDLRAAALAVGLANDPVDTQKGGAP
jgi:hypothetical protein